MKRETLSLLEELEAVAASRDEQHVIESRGVHIIESAINFINDIRSTCDEELAGEFERRLINSIRGQDANKFRRAMKKLNTK